MSNLLAEVEARYIGLGEAAINAVLGFAVVFVGISILILVVWLVGYLFTKVNFSKAEKPAEVAPAVKAESEDDEELAVVISAAIAAYYGEKKRKPEFKVKNLRR